VAAGHAAPPAPTVPPASTARRSVVTAARVAGMRAASGTLSAISLNRTTTPSTTTPSTTETETAPTAQGSHAAEPEAPMTTPRSPRPVHRRTQPTRGGAKPTPPPHVQRARRLVWIGATALATLLLALVLCGWWIAIHLLADVGLVAYLRHLRGIALKQQAARRVRRWEAAEATSDQAAETARPQRRAAPVRRPAAPTAPTAAPPAPRVTAQAPAPTARSSAPAQARRAEAAPVDVIDLTDGALADDCPTTELMAARAV
jgi:hypothetical protein